jgi:hypothetical protein
MAAGFPVKADYATGDVLSAVNMNDLSGTLNYIDPTGETNGFVLTRNSSATGGLEWAASSGAGPANNFNLVTTNESTSSTSYTGLTTAGAVTLTTGTKALVIVGMASGNPSGGARQFMSFGVSGATTRAADDQVCVSIAANNTQSVSKASVVTLTAGSNTFTTQFKTSNDTGSFSNRYLIVIDLGS